MYSLKNESVFSHNSCFMPTLGVGRRNEPGGHEERMLHVNQAGEITALGVASGGDAPGGREHNSLVGPWM